MSHRHLSMTTIRRIRALAPALALLALVAIPATSVHAAGIAAPSPALSPAAAAATACASERINPIHIDALQSSATMTVTAVVTSCSRAAETVDVQFRVLPLRLPAACRVPAWSVTGLRLAPGASRVASSTRSAPTCAGLYVVIGTVTVGNRVLTASSQIIAVRRQA